MTQTSITITRILICVTVALLIVGWWMLPLPKVDKQKLDERTVRRMEVVKMLLATEGISRISRHPVPDIYYKKRGAYYQEHFSGPLGFPSSFPKLIFNAKTFESDEKILLQAAENFIHFVRIDMDRVSEAYTAHPEAFPIFTLEEYRNLDVFRVVTENGGLYLSPPPVSGEAWENLAAMSFGSIYITDRLKRYPLIEKVQLPENCEYLTIEYATLTAEALEDIAKHANITSVTISDCKVADSDLDILRREPRLFKRLDFYRNTDP